MVNFGNIGGQIGANIQQAQQAAALNRSLGPGEYEIFYQGRPCNDVDYTRQPGMAPDSGWVEMPAASATNLLLKVVSSMFSVMGPLVMPQPVHILNFEKVYKGLTLVRNPVPGGGGPAGGGFELAGQLLLRHGAPLPDGKPGQTLIDGVYLDESGIRAAMDDIDTPLTTPGMVRLTLTDIRQFWRQHGRLCGEINIPLRSGSEKHQPRTIRPDGKPFDVGFVLAWAIYHLAGNPVVMSLPPWLRTKQAPAVELNWTSAAEYVDDLLEKFKLELNLNHDLTVSIMERTAKHTVGQFPMAGLGTEQPPARHYHIGPQIQKGYRYVPQIVTVRGARIYQNVRTELVAVSADLQNRIRPLADVIAEAYPGAGEENPDLQVVPTPTSPDDPYGKALQQTVLEEERQYLHLNFYHPEPVAQKWREIAKKWWFKAFMIPSAMMNLNRGFTNPMLPIKDRVVIVPDQDDAAALVARISGTAEQDSTHLEIALDGKHKIKKVAPRITSSYMVQRAITDPNKLLEMMREQRKILDDKLAFIGDQRFSASREDKLKRVMATLKLRKQQATSEITQTKIYRVDGFTGKTLGEAKVHANPDGTVTIDESFITRLGDGLTSVNYQTREVKQEEEVKSLEKLFQQYEAEATKEYVDVSKPEQDLVRKIDEWNKKIDKVLKSKDAYDRPRNSCWFNVHGTVPNGSYQIIAEAGLIMFNEAQILTDSPVEFAQQDHNVLSVAHVEMVYGVESNWNAGAGDYFYCNVGTKPRTLESPSNEEPEVFIFGGLCQSLPRSLYLVEDDDIQLYIDEFGKPFNANKCLEAAAAKATPHLLVQPYVDSYRYVLAGWFDVESRDSIAGVHWYLGSGHKGGVAPMTEVLANDYRWAGGGKSADRKRVDFRADQSFRAVTELRERIQKGAISPRNFTQ